MCVYISLQTSTQPTKTIALKGDDLDDLCNFDAVFDEFDSATLPNSHTLEADAESDYGAVLPHCEYFV